MPRVTGFLLGCVPLLYCACAHADAPASPDRELCRNAATVSEQQHHIPARLLDAISRVESGRYDVSANAVTAWPWTINAQGQGYFYQSKNDAVQAAKKFVSLGISSIDVGCMQVNLQQHPNAFGNIEQAFDPAENARYAGKFLSQLFDQTGNWQSATAAYHSFTPNLGAEYRRKVMAVWDGASASDLYATTPYDSEGGRITPYPFNRPFPINQARQAPRIRNISHGAMALTGNTGRTLASYRSRPVRLAARGGMSSALLMR